MKQNKQNNKGEAGLLVLVAIAVLAVIGFGVWFIGVNQFVHGSWLCRLHHARFNSW